MTDTRQAIGQLFEAMPELTEATLTAGGIQYRARRNGPWLLVDRKEPGRRGWQPWAELRKRGGDMSASERNKGAAAERELFRLLTEQLGVVVVRNHAARWEGGCDSLSVDGWAIECKRCETLSLGAWWNQAQRQAEQTGRKPVLFYRQSRKPWRAVLDLHHVAPDTFTAPGSLCEMALPDACTVIRESLP